MGLEIERDLDQRAHGAAPDAGRRELTRSQRIAAATTASWRGGGAGAESAHASVASTESAEQYRIGMLRALAIASRAERDQCETRQHQCDRHAQQEGRHRRLHGVRNRHFHHQEQEPRASSHETPALPRP